MKKILVLFIATTIANVPVLAQNEVECEFTSITSDITSNTTLSASTLYRIEGCIHVTSGYTLTIPASTVVLFEKASSAGLIVDKGAYLNIQGGPGMEVVFTSDQKPNFRSPGDYAGLIINGQATNNFPSNVMITENRNCNVDAGGNNDDDSSGVIKYLRIEYPGYVTFASVGRKTVLENIQVSYSENNAFQFWGGVPQARELVALNAKINDFEFNYGNRAKIQSVLGLRLDPAANYATTPNSNGILIANNDDLVNGYAGSPETRPILDKFTLIGPGYCGGTGLSGNFKNGVLAYHAAQMGMYHSFISGWPTGLRLEDPQTLANAVASPQTLTFEANSFDNNATNYSHNGTWPNPSCANSMLFWIENSGGTTCGQEYNLFTGVLSGYDASICGDYCNNEVPSFLMSSSEMGETRYEDIVDLDGDPFFTVSDFRGAFDETTDWTESWTLFCPQEMDYCPAERRMGSATGISAANSVAGGGLILSPNPVNGIAYAEFNSESTGNVTVSVVNSLGQVVRSFTHNGAAGKQKVAVNTEGLSSGMYIVNIELAKGQSLHARILVK